MFFNRHVSRGISLKIYLHFSEARTREQNLAKNTNLIINFSSRNAVYNISFDRLTENPLQRIEWSSSEAHQELCTLKGKQEVDCQNYIRVFARISDKQIMICGTNSYKPTCRYYTQVFSEENDTEIYVYAKDEDAQGRCPYNPLYNSTYIYTDGLLYSANVADFGGNNPLIHCEIQPNISLRTDGYDMKQLNQPAFVNALEYNGYVMFFFREQAVEYMNCGKTIYSRVGRVCKNDKGGPYPLQQRWTTFLKTRLNCSVPSEFPFYFDEIQATSKLISGIYGNEKDNLIYMIFSTPPNSIDGSAVCVFSADDVLQAFEGRFKSQRDMNSNWLPVDPPTDPRPGKCVDDSRTLPGITVNFIKNNPLMEDAVEPIHGQPLLIDTTPRYKFSSIVVDPQFTTADKKIYDIIFLGTIDGKVIKFINLESADSRTTIKPYVISEQQVLPVGQRIKEVYISKHTQTLVAVGDGHIVSVPLYNCNSLTRCTDCMELRDPYCAWDAANKQCVHYNYTINTGDKYHQNIKGFPMKSICEDHNQNSVNPQPTIVKPTHGTVSSIGEEITYDGDIPDSYDDNDYDGKKHEHGVIISKCFVFLPFCCQIDGLEYFLFIIYLFLRNQNLTEHKVFFVNVKKKL